MRWPERRGLVKQVQVQIDPPDDGFEERPYRGYPVTMIVRGKRVTVWVTD